MKLLLDTNALVRWHLAKLRPAAVRTVTQVTTRYQRPVEYADLRHAEGYALRLKGVGTTAPAGKPAARPRHHN